VPRDLWIALVFGALAGPLAPRGAAADPPVRRPSSLSWVRLPGAESCIGPRALARDVEQRLGGRALVTPARAEVTIEARIERASEGGGWRATFLVTDASSAPTGRRELHGDAADCRTMDDEIALIVTLLIDPNAALAPLPSAPAPPLVEAPIAPAPAPPPSPPWRVGVQLAMAFGLGLLPRPGGGVTFRVDVTPPRWPTLALGGTAWFDNHTEAGPISATFTLVYGIFSVCPLGIVAVGTRFSACLGLQAGALRAGGFGFDLAYRQEQAVINAVAEVRVRRPISAPIFAELGLVQIVPFVRRGFYYDDEKGRSRDVYQMTHLAGALDAALGIELP